MKTTVASVALAIVFCGLAVAQEMPPPAEGMPAGPPKAVQHGPGPNRPLFGRTISELFGWTISESGGKTRP